jgi:zinc transport system substrate-binding protein
MAQNIYNAIVKSDTVNRAFYQKNFLKLLREIDETDSVVTAVIAKAKNRTFLIYHPSLTYLARDYGLRQFSVELNGKEPTPQYLKSLIEIAKKEQARTIFVQKEFDTKNARILAQESGCEIRVINPIAYEWKDEMLNIAKALSDE